MQKWDYNKRDLGICFKTLIIMDHLAFYHVYQEVSLVLTVHSLNTNGQGLVDNSTK